MCERRGGEFEELSLAIERDNNRDGHPFDVDGSAPVEDSPHRILAHVNIRLGLVFCVDVFPPQLRGFEREF